MPARTVSSRLTVLALAAWLCLASTAFGEAPRLVLQARSLADPELQEDFPALCHDGNGSAWLAYVAYNGTADELKSAVNSKRLPAISGKCLI